MEHVKLGDIATYINGYPFKPEDRGSEGLPIIRIQDLTGNSYDLGFYSGKYPDRIEINDGDVLISWSGSLGVYLWNKGKALLNQHIFKVVFDKIEIDKKYFIYVIQHSLRAMEAKTHGATMKHITKKDFDSMLVPYPNLQRQQEIARILGCVESVISKRKQQLAELDNLIKARFVEMFGECKAYRKFEECLEIKDNMRKPISSAERASMQVGTLYPYYGATGQVGWINDYLSDFDGLCIAEDCGNYHAGEASSYIVRGKIWVNNHAHLLKCVTGVSNLYFINEFFRFADLMDYVNGATRLKLTQSAMKTIPILCPPIELQNQFAAFVEQTDKSKVVVQKALEEAQLLFDSLMQEYFG